MSSVSYGKGMPKLESPKTPEIPSFDMPELEMPELKKPELSTSYNEMLEGLKDEGFGEKKFEGGLKAPEFKKENPDTDAFQDFKETYGDMWKDRELENKGKIPDKELFKAVKDFGKQNEKEFSKQAKKDAEVMAKALKQKLDTSKLWDLNKLKKQADASVSTAGDKAFLNSVPKPKGWGSVAAGSSSANLKTPTPKSISPNLNPGNPKLPMPDELHKKAMGVKSNVANGSKKLVNNSNLSNTRKKELITHIDSRSGKLINKPSFKALKNNITIAGLKIKDVGSKAKTKIVNKIKGKK